MSDSTLEYIPTLQKYLKKYTRREKDDLLLTILRRAKYRFDLDHVQVEQIWKRMSDPPEYCTHVLQSGPWKDTKCRLPVCPTATVCMNHLPK